MTAIRLGLVIAIATVVTVYTAAIIESIARVPSHWSEQP